MSADTNAFEEHPTVIWNGEGEATVIDGAARIAPARLLVLDSRGEPVQAVHCATDEALVLRTGEPMPWAEKATRGTIDVELTVTRDGLRVADGGAPHGAYLLASGKVRLEDGDEVLAGRTLISFEEDTRDRARIRVVSGMRAGSLMPLEHGILIGRRHGDLRLRFDETVSSQHCRFGRDAEGCWVEDLGSSNGTFVRIHTGDVIPFGWPFLVGETMLQAVRADEPAVHAV